MAETTFRPIYKMYNEGTHPNFFFKIENGMDHTISMSELKLVKEWLTERFLGAKVFEGKSSSTSTTQQCEAPAELSKKCAICGAETSKNC